MNDGFLAHDGIPAVRRAVDVVEVADLDLDTIVEPRISGRLAGMVHAVLRDVDAPGRAAYLRQGSQGAAETAGDVEHAVAGTDSGALDQVQRHGRGRFRHGFPARHIAADMDVGAAPACLVERRHGRVIVVRGGLIAIEYGV